MFLIDTLRAQLLTGRSIFLHSTVQKPGNTRLPTLKLYHYYPVFTLTVRLCVD